MRPKKAVLVGVAAMISFGAASSSIWGGQKMGMAKAIDESVKAKNNENKKITPIFPVKGETVNILKPGVVNYLVAMREQAKAIENDYILHDYYLTGGNEKGKDYANENNKVRVAEYNGSSNEGKSKNVVLVFNQEGFANTTEYTLTYGKKQDLSDGVQIKTTANYATITNLLERTTYYWKVESAGVSSEIESFVTPDGFRMITANGITNVRDMGGRPVASGKHIKQGMIFRGGEMVETTYTVGSATHHANLNDGNKAVMQDEIAIKYEVDFRGDDEANNITDSPLKDANHSDVEYLRINNMGAYHYFFQMDRSDPRWAGVKQMFLAFKNANEKHVYFHCWGGADRTGTAGFLLGGLLGMSFTDLIIDYELTSFANNYRPHNFNDTKGVYHFPAFINALRTEKDAEGNLYYAKTKTISKIVEEILMDRAGLTSQDIQEIKDNLLED